MCWNDPVSEKSWLLKEVLERWGSVFEHHEPDNYPRELETSFVAKNGERVSVRPVRPDDVPLFKAGFAKLSDETIYRRFHAHIDHLSDETYHYLTHLDYQHHLALIALDPNGDAVGVARYYLPEGKELAEAAVIVGDPWHGQGVGSFLLRRLADAAEARGIAGFEAFIQRDNLLMRRMVERSGFVMHTREAGPDAVHVWGRFEELVG